MSIPNLGTGTVSEDLGTYNFQVTWWGLNGNPLATSPAQLRKMIQKKVCEAGGDFVVGEVNGMGYYIRATVFKEKKN